MPIGVKVASEPVNRLPIVRQGDVLRQHIAVVDGVGKPVFILVIEFLQFLGAADAVHKMDLPVAALLGLAHLALLPLGQVHNGVRQKITFVQLCQVDVLALVADLAHAEVAVGGEVKIVGSVHAVHGCFKQLAAADAGDTVGCIVDPDRAERHLLVGVGGGARNGIAHVKVNTVMGLCIRPVGRAAGRNISGGVALQLLFDAQRTGAAVVAVHGTLVVEVPDVQDHGGGVIGRCFGVQLVDAHQPIQVPVAVFLAVLHIVRRGGVVGIRLIVRIRVDARITVHHIVADQKAVTLADVVCQRPGCRAGNIRFVIGGSAHDHQIVDVIALGVRQVIGRNAVETINRCSIHSDMSTIIGPAIIQCSAQKSIVKRHSSVRNPCIENFDSGFVQCLSARLVIYTRIGRDLDCLAGAAFALHPDIYRPAVPGRQNFHLVIINEQRFDIFTSVGTRTAADLCPVGIVGGFAAVLLVCLGGDVFHVLRQANQPLVVL